MAGERSPTTETDALADTTRAMDMSARIGRTTRPHRMRERVVGSIPGCEGSVDGRVNPSFMRTPAVHAQLRPDRAAESPAEMPIVSWWRLPSAGAPVRHHQSLILRVDHAEAVVICGVRTFFTGIKS